MLLRLSLSMALLLCLPIAAEARAKTRPPTRAQKHPPKPSKKSPKTPARTEASSSAPAPEEKRADEANKPAAPPVAIAADAFASGETWRQLKTLVGNKEAPRKLRVVHLGDSEIGGDWVARDIRKALQASFGDGGPGFVFVASPFDWYLREGFRTAPPDGFKARTVAQIRTKSQLLGFGGVRFDALRADAQATVQVKPAVAGKCRVQFFYAAQPGGGRIALTADGKPLEQLSTDGTEFGPASKEWSLEKCPTQLAVKVESLPARLYGWNVEREGAGVVWNTIGLVSSTMGAMRRERPGQLAKSLALLEPDLVVFSYGLNVSAPNVGPGPSNHEANALKGALGELRQLAPSSACLVMTPYPIAARTEAGLVGNPAIGLLASKERPIALGAGCAFLDREQLMGGPETALKWLKASPKVLSDDHVHLTPSGTRTVGDAVGRTLLRELTAQH